MIKFARKCFSNNILGKNKIYATVITEVKSWKFVQIEYSCYKWKRFEKNLSNIWQSTKFVYKVVIWRNPSVWGGKQITFLVKCGKIHNKNLGFSHKM